MNAHKIEVVLAEDGTLILRGLPFHAGDTVEVIILEAKIPQQTTASLASPEANKYPLRGKVGQTKAGGVVAKVICRRWLLPL